MDSRDSRHYNRILRNNQARRIQRFLRTIEDRRTMTFVLNPYDRVLDLNDKEDRKLFDVACKGLD